MVTGGLSIMIRRGEIHEGIAVRRREAMGGELGRMIGRGRIFREVGAGNCRSTQ